MEEKLIKCYIVALDDENHALISDDLDDLFKILKPEIENANDDSMFKIIMEYMTEEEFNQLGEFNGF